MEGSKYLVGMSLNMIACLLLFLVLLINSYHVSNNHCFHIIRFALHVDMMFTLYAPSLAWPSLKGG